MSTPRQRFAAVTVAAFVAAGCGHVIPGSLTGGAPFDFAHHACTASKDTDPARVEVRSLGSGGVYVRWRDDAILIGASFSNPGLLRAYRGRLKFEPAQIERLQDLDLKRVRAIFAGHSHYDHIGDLPIVARDYLPGVPVYVNQSGVNMLSAYPIDARTLVANDPIPVPPSITVTPIISEHAPQVCRWRRFPLCRYAVGEVREPWTTPWPQHRLSTMLGGKTFAFVIELRDGDTLRYRIYYNDSSAGAPLGQIADGDIDLAILCMAQWNWVRDYPGALLANLKPRHVLVSHWDDFFRKDGERSAFVPNLSNRNAARFLRKLSDGPYVSGSTRPTNAVCGVSTARWTMAVPGSSLLFDPR